MTAPIHEVRSERVDGVDVVRVSGEIDLSNAAALGQALRSTNAPSVALELGALTYIDSAGIRAVDEGYRALSEEGRSLAVVIPPGSQAEWIFRVTGLSESLVAPSLAAALAALRDGG